MKQCPFCGADIEENAKFCLYCMTSLTEKEQILVHKQKKPQGLLILAAIVAAALILLLLLLDRREVPDVESQTTDTSVSSTTTEITSVPTTQATTVPTVETTETTTEETTEPTQAASQPTTKPSSKPSTQPSQPTQSTQPEEEPTVPETTETADEHIHSFHLKYTLDKYLCSEADCETPAYYYYACSCGAKGEDTYSTGKAKGHTPATLEGYPATCVTDGKTDGTYCTVCQVVLEEQKTIWTKGHLYAFSSSPTACQICGEIGTITFSAPAFPIFTGNHFRINSGYYRALYFPDQDLYCIRAYFNYTNISSETTDDYPFLIVGVFHDYVTPLGPNESATYSAMFDVGSHDSLYVKFQ